MRMATLDNAEVPMLRLSSHARIATAMTLLAALGWLATACPAASAVNVIPAPVSIEQGEGSFILTPATRIIARGAAWIEASKLIDALAPATGFVLRGSVSLSQDGTAIELKLDDSAGDLGGEGYTLEVTRQRVTMIAKKPAGLFYGIQTLLQLMSPAVFSETVMDDVAWEVPSVKIADSPRFPWRGLLLDPARHFIAKSAVLRFIDTMALHKFNSLQLHLTDDQGWRIEIKKYPKLTEVGAWRKETVAGHARNRPMRFDGKRHGGFYTQDDIREIVQYAAARHIRVVPEIEMPGHAASAISAYPYLGVFPKKQKDLSPLTYWGVSPHIFGPRPATVTFLQDVLAEVLELFPSEHIHVGGDEAVKNQWKASEEVQAIIRDKGLKDEEELQSWFIEQMDTFLTERGRRLVGWDEILQGGLAPGATVMSWRGQQGGIAAANAGHDVVMAPTSHTYFDYYQGPAETEPLSIGGNLPLAKVYSYDPIPAAIAPEKAKHVLGVQGQLWGEYIPTPEHLDYMTYPRAAALAEVAWSAKEAKDYEQFLGRLRCHLSRLEVMRVKFRPLD